MEPNIPSRGMLPPLVAIPRPWPTWPSSTPTSTPPLGPVLSVPVAPALLERPTNRGAAQRTLHRHLRPAAPGGRWWNSFDCVFSRRAATRNTPPVVNSAKTSMTVRFGGLVGFLPSVVTDRQQCSPPRLSLSFFCCPVCLSVRLCSQGGGLSGLRIGCDGIVMIASFLE